MRIIGIAGGAGSGKSSLTQKLKAMFPHLVEVVEFDDYALQVSQVPFWNGVPNWEVPEAYDFLSLRQDILALQRGRSVVVMHLDTTEYVVNKKIVRKSLTIEPKPLIIVEGFLILHDPSIRELLDYSFFLDVSVETRLSRRKFPFPSAEYSSQVFVPMNGKYVDSTKMFADQVISVDGRSLEMVYSDVVNLLKKSGFL